MRSIGTLLVVEVSLGVDYSFSGAIGGLCPHNTALALAAFIRGSMDVIGEQICP